jgi:hypothetical protein
MKLDKKFDSFLGKEVLVKITPREYKGFNCDKYDVSEEDITISSLRAEALKDGLSLRVWFPRSRGTMDARSDRLNVHIDEQKDGTFQITRINIG